MADRFPLVVDSSNNNIKELPSGDNLDLTGSGIVTSSNGNILLTPNGSGVVRIDGTTGIDMESGSIGIKNSGSVSNIKLYCESSNAHYVQLQSPAHADYSGNVTLTLPSTTGTLIGSDAENVVKIDGAVSEKAATNATISSTTAALDVRDGSVFQLTLASNISTFNWSNHAASGHVSSFVMKVIQDVKSLNEELSLLAVSYTHLRAHET